MVDAARRLGGLRPGDILSGGKVTFDKARFSGGTINLSAPAICDVPPTFEDCTISPKCPGPNLPSVPATPTALGPTRAPPAIGLVLIGAGEALTPSC